VTDRSKGDEERQDAGLSRNDDGEDSELREGAQGPWKTVPGAAVATPAVPQVPEPGLY